MARIISVTGSQGGAGKTFVALNLAYALYKELGTEILLVDGNFPLSQHCIQFHRDAENHPYLDGILLEQIGSNTIEKPTFSPKIVSGVGICGINSGQFGRKIHQEQTVKSLVHSVLDLALGFDTVVIDAGVNGSELASALFDISSEIVLVCEADSIGAARLAQDREYFQRLNFSNALFKIVLNKVNADSVVTEDWLYGSLGVKASGFIPLNTLLPFPFLEKNKKVASKSEVNVAFQRLILNLGEASKDYKAIDAYLSYKARKEDNEKTQGEQKKHNDLKLAIHDELLELMDLKRLETGVDEDPKKLKELENKTRQHAISILDKRSAILDRESRDRIITELIREILYLGPLEELLENEDVNEIMVNDWQTIYVEEKGKLKLSDLSFLSDKQLMRIIERIVAPLGRRIDISSPMVDARLKDGSRVNIIIPPLAPKGSIVTIRKFAKEAYKIDDLVALGTINSQVIAFLEAAVNSKLNLIISGGTGTGKTTLLNILSSFVPSDERIATVEDSAELQLVQPHVLTLEARPSNVEGKGEVSIRDLVKNALRMRPDRIVVGECRSGEALDMLQAMNTGHDGSMTTIHANSSREMLTRLETLVMYAGTDLPSRAIREQIRGALDLIIQISRFKDGSRKVTQISEVTGMNGNELCYEDVFRYQQTGINNEGKVLGQFIATGYVPKSLERFKANGFDLPKEMFWHN